MLLDYTSLLLATGISALCLACTMTIFRLSGHSGDFMTTWSIGLVLIVAHVIGYWFYVTHPVAAVGAFVIVSLPCGIAVVYAAARQFAFGSKPLKPFLCLAGAYLAVVSPVIAAGYDGIGLILQNAAVSTLLVLSGLVYLKRRQDAPLTIYALAASYFVMGISFALCGAVLFLEGQWRIGHAPENWAENLNVVVAVVALTVTGALSVSLDQARLARSMHRQALTDPLTGLINRRALFETCQGRTLRASDAIVMFDLDHFKSVNDRHGHGVGDEVLLTFANVLLDHAGPHSAARLGGEEFVLVLFDVAPEAAGDLAAKVTAAFAAVPVATRRGPISCTVSAGIGVGSVRGTGFEAVLSRADHALYRAKNAGRNRVESPGLRLAG